MIIVNLKDGERLIINGPEETRCTRCGKHVDELIPFDLTDDTLPYHAYGKRLVQNFRVMDLVEYDERWEMILKDLAVFGESEEHYEFYGRAKVEDAIYYDEMRRFCELSWECRDCIKEEGTFKYYGDNED